MNVLRFVGATHLIHPDHHLPDDVMSVPQFDKWPAFFELMPGLLRSADAALERT